MLLPDFMIYVLRGIKLFGQPQQQTIVKQQKRRQTVFPRRKQQKKLAISTVMMKFCLRDLPFTTTFTLFCCYHSRLKICIGAKKPTTHKCQCISYLVVFPINRKYLYEKALYVFSAHRHHPMCVYWSKIYTLWCCSCCSAEQG